MRTTMDLSFASLVFFCFIYPAVASFPRLDKWISRAMTREQVVQRIGKPPCATLKDVAAIIPDESANSKIGLADAITQRHAPWGLARISHRPKLDLSNHKKYEYDNTAGDGTNVYVLDSGIYTDHAEFEARASWGTSIVNDSGSVDTNGHGTLCAGIIASRTNGVAKKSNLIAVKVFDNPLAAVASDLIDGLQWAVADHHHKSAATGVDGTGFKGSVIFLNLGVNDRSLLATRRDNPLVLAINGAIDTGIQVVMPAGNENINDCSPPVRQLNAVIVGASDLNDERTYFSNFGSCITLFAPGLSITSTWVSGEHSVRTVSGTEMAAAHVAGLLAYLQSLQPEVLAPADLKSLLLKYATKDLLGNMFEGTPNLLAFNNVDGSVED